MRTRTYYIYCKSSVKHDCLHITSSWNSEPPKGYYPISYVYAPTKSEALLAIIPRKFLIPEELHAQLNFFNKSNGITHHVYSKLSKRADCVHVIFTTSPISIKSYHHISSLNAFSISDAMNQFVPKIFLTPNTALQAYLNDPRKNPLPTA